jgi:hypothetical protein
MGIRPGLTQRIGKIKGAMTKQEALKMNAEGFLTAGCAYCIESMGKLVVGTKTSHPMITPPKARTQWLMTALTPDPRASHRFLCPEHLARVAL